MNLRLPHFLVCTCTVLLLLSCSQGKKANIGKPIVLGDSSTIVTESDPQYLQDYVADMHPNITTDSAKKDTAKTAVATTPVAAPAAGKEGLNIAFGDVTVFIPNVSTAEAKHPIKGNGATYQMTKGDLNGNKIQVTGGSISKVSMQYQTGIIASNDLGKLALTTLSHSSSWLALKGSNGFYDITGLEDTKLEYTHANAGAIRTAVTKAVRARHLNRRVADKWLNSIRSTRSIDNDPLEKSLRSVIFKIEGKDAAGKAFTKQVRLDLPA
ncbi:MAG: hypothetical protein WCG87_02655 [Bacteroidota bacterium]